MKQPNVDALTLYLRNTSNETDDWLTTREAMDFTGLSRSQLYYWRRKYSGVGVSVKRFKEREWSMRRLAWVWLQVYTKKKEMPARNRNATHG